MLVQNGWRIIFVAARRDFGLWPLADTSGLVSDVRPRVQSRHAIQVEPRPLMTQMRHQLSRQRVSLRKVSAGSLLSLDWPPAFS
jgi:hypothetical protein